ncbi:MAG: T9SS type A sorting domain-containing protein [Saprospirales bacterium]|nr:T9SS type A sorting domain-containing protein [Saprospirales bacterium]
MQDGKLSDWLRISSHFTPKEAYNGEEELLDVRLLFEGTAAAQEEGFALYQNRPNPFRQSTQIAFELPEATTARLTVWDASGKVLKVIEGAFAKGYNEVQLGQLMVSGVLYYKLETPTHVAVRKMIALE